MLNRLMERRIEAFERAFGYDASYMKEILEASRGAFLKVSRLGALAGHREAVPADVWHAARLVATMHEDCGTCTQLIVDMARKDGVPEPLLGAVVTRADQAMSAEVRLGCRYARAVLARSPADELRAEVVRRWGRRGLVSLALGIAGSRLYPTLKYALGHGRACQSVRVGATSLAVKPAV